MITTVMPGKIRRMFYRDGLSRSEISRRTGLSRNTIKKWLKAIAQYADHAALPGGALDMSGDILLSTQVLQEFYVAVTCKLVRPLDVATAAEILLRPSKQTHNPFC